MICSKCGHVNPDEARFCGNCATPLTAEAAEQSAAPPSAPPTVAMQTPMEGQYQQPPRKGMPGWAWALIILFICGCGGVILLPALLFPVFSQAKMQAKKAYSVSLGKQVGTSMAIYLADFDDKFPPFSNSEEIAHKLDPYMKGSSPSTTSDGQVYESVTDHARRVTWNSEISGQLSSLLNFHAWMFYDPTPYGDYKVITHIDTSTNAYKSDEFEAQLKLPLKEQ